MAYKTIEELLEYEKYPWEYDFKNENSNKEYIEKARNTNNQLVKFALYKRDDSFDTDGTKTSQTCGLTREIYRKLFGFNDKIKEEENQINRYGKCDINDDEFGPETMNTAMKVLCYFCFKKFKVKLNKFPNCSFNTPKQKFSNKFLIHTVLEHRFDIEVSKDIKEIISEYLSSITNIGNYCLVPAYLNPARGANGLNIESEGEKKRPKIDDYFDITLFFMSTKFDKDKWLYNKSEIKWDKKNFLKFINMSLLWDYCIFNNEKQVYGVKKLFAGNEDFKKGISTSILCNKNIDCEEKNDFSKFMENVIWCIKRRGFLMTLFLLLKQYKSTKYNVINESILENKIHTMNEAINMVLSIYGLEKDNELLMTFEDNTIHEVYNEFKQKLCNEM